MSIEDDALMYSIPVDMREDIKAFLRARKITFQDIRKADLNDVWGRAKVNGLCAHLARHNHRLRDICAVTRLSKEQAEKVIHYMRTPDVPYPLNKQGHEYA